MANLNLGNVAIVPKGVWNATLTYEKLNTVTYNGSSYVATKPVSAGILPTNTAYWQMIAAKGDKGEQGIAATIHIGTTTTLTPSSPATVTNSGTTSDAVFDFGIPQGIQGLQGVQGEQGVKGEQGDAATISVGTTTTLAAGSSATVTNVGTSSDAVFDFGIPQGLQGIQGEKGDTGAQGESGLDLTVSQTLIDVQKETARNNIAAASAADLQSLAEDVQLLEWKVGTHKYIIRWDKVNAQCTRLGDAAEITTDITHFAHRGSIDPAYNNPFDSLYPWSARKLCKVDSALYQQIYASGGTIEDCVTLWEDEPGFGLGASVPGMDMVYTPIFWRNQWEDENYVYVGVADGEVPGWTKRPAVIGARYHAADDGNGGLTSLAGTIAKRFVSVQSFHATATAQSMTLDDIYTWSDDTVLMCVEYATLNTQNAVGYGVSSLYTQDDTGHPLQSATATNSVILPAAYKSSCIANAVLDVGTTVGNGNITSRAVISAADYSDTTYCVVTFDGLPMDVDPSQFWAIHGLANTANAEIGSRSGYIGTNGQSISYYRGRATQGNYYYYVLGAYREQNTGHIWIANSREQAAQYDALNKTVHTDTGFVLPQGADGADLSGFINGLYLLDDVPLSPLGNSIGGNSTNPVGDYIYVPPIATVNTILLAGSRAGNGASVGRFSGAWYSAASSSPWSSAASLFLKSPTGG